MGFISVVIKVVGLGQGIQSQNAQVIDSMSRDLDMGANILYSCSLEAFKTYLGL